jgi:hypothetical protein
MMGYESMDSGKAEMWATLTSPPAPFATLIGWLEGNNRLDLVKKINQTSAIWNTVDANEVIRKFNIACARYMIGITKMMPRTSVPDYWDQVQALCRRCVGALDGVEHLGSVIFDALQLATNIAHIHRTGNFFSHAGHMHIENSGPVHSALYCATYAASNETGKAIQFAVNAITEARILEYAAAQEELIEIFINIMLTENANKG